jgi:Zn-finger nucleic acid-binding protein
VYRVAATNQYACPRCLRPFVTYQVGVYLVDACVDCGGLFLDNATTREVLSSFDRSLVGVATTLGIGKGETLQKGVNQRNLTCPKCSAGLQTVEVPAAQVELDVCTEHGTWFDANELPKVARAYKRSRGSLANDALGKVLDGALRAGPA